MSKINVERATVDDISFITEGIIHAARSGQNFSSFQRIFNLSDEEWETTIVQMLECEIPNNAFSISDFFILKNNGEYAATACFWIEGKDGPSNKVITANLLKFCIDKERFYFAPKEAHLAINEIEIEREKGALQIEWVYVKPAFRGGNILKDLFEQSIVHLQKENIFNKVQIISIVNNNSATKAFSKLNFKPVKQTASSNSKLLREYFPGEGYFLWEKLYNI